jgi:hypothetical protein
MHSSASHTKFIAGSLVILLFAFMLRAVNLLALPVFIDEGTHLYWARLYAAGRSDYPFYMDGRLLAILLYAGLDPAGTSLWLGRAVSAILSTLNVAVALAVGRRLGRAHWAGWLTGALYAVLPLAVFHDRQMLTQTVSAAFGSLVWISGLRLAAPAARWKSPALFALSLPAAILANVNAALLGFFPVVAWLVVPRRRAERVAAALRFGTAGIAAAALAGSFLWMMSPRLGTPGGVLTDPNTSLVQCPPALCRGDWAEQWRRLPDAANSLIEIVPPYVGWGLIALAVLGAVAPGPRRREALALGLAMAAFLAAAVASVHYVIFPRYVIYLTAPLVAIAVRGFALIVTALRGRLRWAAIAAGLAALVWAAPNTLAIVARPAEAALPPVDVRQYRTGIYSGIGFEAAVKAMEAQLSSSKPPALILLGTKWHVLPLTAYADPARFETQAAEDLTWADIVAMMKSRKLVFVLDEATPGRPPEEGALIIPRSGEARPLRVRALDASAPETFATLYAELYSTLFVRPDAFLNEYDQLLADTLAQSGQIVLAPYPPYQAEFMRERLRPNEHVTILEAGGAQPWDSGAVIGDLQGAAPDKAILRAIFLEETRLDPARAVETWLNMHRFRLGEQWYGPLRAVDYAGAGPATQTLSITARFGEAIGLERAELLDDEIAPGGLLRLRLIWRAEAATAQRLKVFAHVITAEGALIAQHDGQPVGELRPTNTWQAGETIADQFAIRLPADAPSGDYTLRIGLYDAESLARTPVRLADGAIAEFYVGGKFTVK